MGTTDLKRISVLSSCLVLLILGGFDSSAVASAAQAPVSGKFQLFFRDSYVGNATYTIFYEFPEYASVGSNLTIPVSLQVNGLGGLEEHVISYQIDVELSLPHGQGMTQQVFGNSPLYTGAIWGPRNVTFSVTSANTGLGTGQAANASVTIRLGTSVRIGYPYDTHITQSDARLVGNIAIVNGPVVATTRNSNYLGYFMLGTGCILISVGVFFSRLFPVKRQATAD
jgi:hypothetical protein